MDKSEVLQMEEGMSSEQLDALIMDGEEPEVEETDDSKLAQEALDATDESSPAEESAKDETTEKDEKDVESEPESTPEPELTEEQQQLRAKDSKIASMKHENRDLAITNARLEGRLEAQAEMQTATEQPVKSPLDIAEAEYREENGDIEGFTMSGDLYRRQKAFDDKAVADKTAIDTQTKTSSSLEQTAATLQEGDFSAEKMGNGLDLQSVFDIAEKGKHFTAGDRLDISDIQAQRGTAVALKEAYNIGIRRIIAAGGEDAKSLQSAIDSKSKSQPKPKLKTNIDTLITEDEDEGETETVTTNERLKSFVGETFFS